MFRSPQPPSERRAPAWWTPGPLRGPLHHQGRRSGSSRGARRRELVRGRRSRPGQAHAGGPRSEGALGGAKHSKDARASSKGSSDFWAFETCRPCRSRSTAALLGKFHNAKRLVSQVRPVVVFMSPRRRNKPPPPSPEGSQTTQVQPFVVMTTPKRRKKPRHHPPRGARQLGSGPSLS